MSSSMTLQPSRNTPHLTLTGALICRDEGGARCIDEAFGMRTPRVTLDLMSRFVEDVRRAVARGDLPRRFRPDDVRRACPGWADHTYGVFLPTHRRGNPGGYTEYFLKNPDGTYSLIR
jgi:hypothetical protein